ncbi:putative thrombospondin type 1 domain-containing protein [Schistosoma mansoni]|uniref:putative thrombospondin type 1 domain-containing protein n=1 Tax=Schistosoma mansoni TaxID=6183 RepID=UPI00022DC105|nr:putative thrombospondin type 1 domain-containing protein [Schistosoma mansoni]|eukprot:XP_018652797.1 putative thrombospondin type 1 domain-containing protein [Schistosoma mansoni]
MIIPNDEILNNIPIKIRSKLGSIYAYDYECVCVNGYTFNHTLKKCVPIKKHCDSSVCLNNGECEYLPENERSIPDIEFICKCPPAWKGLSCEKPRNPCLEAQRLCGQYSCYRDPTNLKLGYRCDCPKGYKAISTTNPQCININECIEYINDEICLNGGICIDKEPYSIIEHDVIEVTYGFQCICSNGYSGQRCERRPPPLQWTTWSEWTECSVKCGIGVHKRFRNCSLPNRCIGSYVQVSKCQGHVLFCENEEINEFIQSGSKIIKSVSTPKEYLTRFIFPILLPAMEAMLEQAKQGRCFESFKLSPENSCEDYQHKSVDSTSLRPNSDYAKKCTPKEYLTRFIFPILLPAMEAMLEQAKQGRCKENPRSL